MRVVLDLKNLEEKSVYSKVGYIWAKKASELRSWYSHCSLYACVCQSVCVASWCSRLCLNPRFYAPTPNYPC